MLEVERTVFFLNLFNALTVLAHLKQGLPDVAPSQSQVSVIVCFVSVSACVRVRGVFVYGPA